jgi:hypothetical protein
LKVDRSQKLAERINEELATDRSPHRLLAEDLDLFYQARIGLPADVARYANEAAMDNGIEVADIEPHSRLAKVLLIPALFLLGVGCLGLMFTLPFTLISTDSLQQVFWFVGLGLLFLLAALGAEVFHS